MKKPSTKGKSFWVIFFVNLLFQTEWLILALILFALHHLFGLPKVFSQLVFGYWGLTVFIIPFFLKWVRKGSETKRGQRTSERIQDKENEQKDDEWNYRL